LFHDMCFICCNLEGICEGMEFPVPSIYKLAIIQ
jgi:hypothetical protein